MKKVILILSVLFISSVYSDCGTAAKCSDCVANEGCGWCAPTMQCLNGTEVGPNPPDFCLGDAWEFGTCTDCTAFSDCQSCFARQSDCKWCPAMNNGLGGCFGKAENTCTASKTCPCSVYGTCSDCLVGNGCGWCGESQTCQNTSVSCNSTLVTDSCPCSANQDCPSCRATAGCTFCSDGTCIQSSSQTCTAGAMMVISCPGYCRGSGKLLCDDCISKRGCAWCAQQSQCVDTASNPCPYVFTCPVCNSASYCDTCNNMDGCIWCDDSKTCELAGSACFQSHTCQKYCESNSDCVSCSGSRGCAWCDDLNSCEDIEVASCMFTHTCGSTPIKGGGHKFSGGSFVGGMFFVIGLLALAVGGYMFYRWRTGKKFDYRELH